MGSVDALKSATGKFIESILNATPNSFDGIKSFGKETFSLVKELVQGPCVKIEVSVVSPNKKISHSVLSASAYPCLPWPDC